MSKYFIKDIAKILNGKIIGKHNAAIKYLLIDSRTLISPSDSLFFAIVGARHNGHNFIDDLYKKQVRNFVVETRRASSLPPPNFEEYPEANFILVKDTLTALQQLCAYHRKQFDIPVVGITGSNGKTIVKEWLFQLLEDDKNIVRSPKSYNSQVGVPLSVWLLNTDADIAIYEAGISQVAEMEKLQPIIRPTIGLFTNIGQAHQESFHNIKQKIDEKLKLFYQSEALIFCKDYHLLYEKIKSTPDLSGVKHFCWSKDPDIVGADLQITKVMKQSPSRHFVKQTTISGNFQNKQIEITIPFIDDASIENAIHCWAFLLYLDYEQEYIQKRMKLLASVAMRLELKEGINNCTIIDDSYNSDIESLGIALDFLNQQKQHTRKTLIISDILQTGRNEKILYSDVANLVNKKNIYQIVGIGQAISRQAELFTIKKNFFSSTDDFLKNLSQLQLHDEAVLLKGARSFEFERISKALQQKVHKTVLEINLNAIVQNLNYFRSLLKPSTKVMAIVKAFSYGSGIYEIANLLQYQRTDYLAVAFADEGVELRKAGISLPILVMNPEEQSFNLMIEHHLEPEIYSFKALSLFYEAVKKNSYDKSPESSGEAKFPVHIKLDTGMRRLGFVQEDISLLVKRLKKHYSQCIKIKTIFSHLAASDEPVHDDFTRLQIEHFETMSNQIISAFNYPVLRHILNSSGVERFPEAQYDMIRLGIGLYGISVVPRYASLRGKNQHKLNNVSTLKSTISQIKKVSANETVGYSRKGAVNRDSLIAVVPIGYADGLSRKLGNGVGKVLINKQFAPILGNICMDMCIIDITDIDAKEGDEVIIFGDMYNISELAKQLNTIPYEILTNISRRVKRVYFHE